MNVRMVVYIICRMLGVEAVLLLVPAVVGLLYGEHESVYFFFVSVIMVSFYFLAGWKRPKDTTIYGKEGMIIVSGAWVVWSLLGALPYYFSGVIPSYLNAFFETVSGFTTTGATILADVEILPKSIMLWRSLTQWIGGMGVLIFVMVITSLDEKNSMYLVRAEVPGPDAGKLLPKSRDSAKLLYSMYFGLTLLLITLLGLGGMDFFDSVVYAFSTAGTGGFAVHNNSVGGLSQTYFHVVIGIFMFLFGINFNLFFLLLKKKVKPVWKNEELRAYVGLIGVSVLLLTINVYSYFGSVWKTLQYTSFQVVSVISSTGFSTANYDLWPEFSKCVLLTLMIVGACAGSTGGGIKISRALIIVKSIKKEVVYILHPKSVSVVKVNDRKISNATMRGVFVYLIAYVLIVIASILIVSLDNMGFTETVTSVISNISNMGPGFGNVGPVNNYSSLSALSKIVLCLDMFIGRLEIFPFFLLFSPQVWGRKF